MNKLGKGVSSSARKLLVAAWLLAVGVGTAATAMAVPQTFFGEDLGLGELVPRPDHPNADAARAAFFANLVGVGTETLESFGCGQTAPVPISFPSTPPIVATLQGSGNIVCVPPGQTNGFGRYAISDSKFWENSFSFSIDFSSPIAAFGFYGVDVGDFQGRLKLTLTDGTTTELTVPNTIGAPGGTIIYFAFIDTENQYIRVSFGQTAPGVDFFAFDDFSVGGLCQVGSISLAPAHPDSNCVDTVHTVTATLTALGQPIPNRLVTFLVASGPNAGAGDSAFSDVNGQATFGYTGAGGAGTDVITASFVDSCGDSHETRALKDWKVCNQDPDCRQAAACVAVLWPPNHKYHAVDICGVTDPDGDPVTITVTGVTQDEPINTRGDGNTCPDAQIVDGRASVRAERTGTPGIPGNGRVYAISFVATDGRGGRCAGTVNVCVPHDDDHPTCVDDGQRYNSLGSCTGGVVAVEAVSLKVSQVTASEAEFSFALPTSTPIDLSVFDVAGRRVATVEHSTLSSGAYERRWNMASVPSGFYFARLQAGGVVVTKTVIAVR